MTEFIVRDFRPSDYSSAGRTHDSIYPDHPYFRKRAEYEDSCYGRTRYRMKRLVAEGAHGEIVGFGEYKHFFFQYHLRRFGLDIEVHPHWQGKGVGTMLYDRLVEDLARAGADVVSPLVLSTQDSAVRFLRRRGFVEKRRTIESRLNLGTFDGAEFARMAEELEDEGIVVSSFASELRKDPSAGRKLKDLEDSGAGDVPGAIVDSPMSFHDYEIVILKSPVMIWEGSFVAKDGDVYVGESSLLESGAGETIDQGFTVVRPSHRGRDIAQSVKLGTIMYARSKGARYIRTHNDSKNHPMLAVNRKMGFVKTVEWIILEKSV